MCGNDPEYSKHFYRPAMTTAVALMDQPISFHVFSLHLQIPDRTSPVANRAAFVVE
jgi:hypothetical protein